MARGRLEPPNLDDRTWEGLEYQALELRKRYAPEWTDASPSDLGVTLVELFAYLVEQLIFRLNRVPDRSYIEFLNLLGVTRDPPQPAETLLRFTINPALPSLVIPAGTQASTTPSEKAAPVVFETDESLDALPTDLVAAWFKAAGAAATDQTGPLALADPPQPKPAGLSVGIAAGQKAELFLGFTAKPAAVPVVLRLGVKGNPGETKFTLRWAVSVAASDVWAGDFSGTNDGTSGLTRSGRVTVEVPTANHTPWAARPAAEVTGVPADPAAPPQKKLFWLRASLTGAGSVDLRHVLFNSVPASTALSAVAKPARERLGTTADQPGVPFQAFTLRQTPVYRVPGVPDPFRHVKVSVVAESDPADAPGTPWPAEDDWPPEGAAAVRLSAASGTVQFGSFEPVKKIGRGLIPPTRATVFADAYRYVATGAAGNLPAGKVTAQQTVVVDVLTVTNPVPAAGGVDEEPVEATLRRAAELLRNRDRVVTPEDAEYLAYEASSRVHHARCLPALVADPDGDVPPPNTGGGLSRTAGSVIVIVVPNDRSVRNPAPPPELIEAVTRYLTDRRTLTAAVTVHRPRYRAVTVTLVVFLFPNPVEDRNQDERRARLRENLRMAIRDHLHPVGGNRGDGWEVGQPFFLAGLVEVIQPILTGQGYVKKLTAKGDAEYTPPLAANSPAVLQLDAAVGVGVADFELICGAELPPEAPTITFEP